MYLKCGYKLIGWLLKRNFEKVYFPLLSDKTLVRYILEPL